MLGRRRNAFATGAGGSSLPTKLGGFRGGGFGLVHPPVAVGIGALEEDRTRFGELVTAQAAVAARSGELAAAFNDMQAQIRTLVHERTRVLAAIAHDLRTYLTRLCAEFIDGAEHRAKAARDLDERTALINDTLFLAARGGALHPARAGRGPRGALGLRRGRPRGNPRRGGRARRSRLRGSA